MSLLRPCSTARLTAFLIPVSQRFSLHQTRRKSQETSHRSTESQPKSAPSDSPAAKSGDSSMIRQEDASEGIVHHQPDYHAPVDHGTS